MELSLLARTRGILERYNLRARKELSQNFLVSEPILSRIVEAVEVRPGEPILEVGAGLGILTEALADAGGKVTALEVDPKLCSILKDRFKDRLEITPICGNVLKFDPHFTQKVKGVGNLPYHLSGKILRWFLDRRDSFSDLHFMLQKEVAERIVSEPGTQAYGVLSVLCRHFTLPSILFIVPPEAFLPVPQVESAFVRLVPKSGPLEGGELLVPLVKEAFKQRRKTLFNNLKSWNVLSPDAWKSFLESLGIDEKTRAESLPVETFERIAAKIPR